MHLDTDLLYRVFMRLERHQVFHLSLDLVWCAIVRDSCHLANENISIQFWGSSWLWCVQLYIYDGRRLWVVHSSDWQWLVLRNRGCYSHVIWVLLVYWATLFDWVWFYDKLHIFWLLPQLMTLNFDLLSLLKLSYRARILLNRWEISKIVLDWAKRSIFPVRLHLRRIRH